jgi:hypothetical protein
MGLARLVGYTHGYGTLHLKPLVEQLYSRENEMTAIDAHADPFVEKQRRDTWSTWFRRRRFGLIERQIEAISRVKGQCRIIDVGGRAEYWEPAIPTLERCKAHVTIVNLENTQQQAARLFGFSYGNACDLSEWADNSFDLAHSNSLIEHLGTWDNMRRCASEIRRVADAYYVQTPNFWFPYEPHFRSPFFHWLPEQTRARLVTRFALGYFKQAATIDKAMVNVESVRLVDRAQMATLFPDAKLEAERFVGLAKSLIAIRHSKASAES